MCAASDVVRAFLQCFHQLCTCKIVAMHRQAALIGLASWFTLHHLHYPGRVTSSLKSLSYAEVGHQLHWSSRQVRGPAEALDTTPEESRTLSDTGNRRECWGRFSASFKSRSGIEKNQHHNDATQLPKDCYQSKRCGEGPFIRWPPVGQLYRRVNVGRDQDAVSVKYTSSRASKRRL